MNNYNIASPVASPQNTTTYLVTGENEYGCKNADSIIVTVRQPFKIHIVADSFVCAGKTIPLQPTGASSYHWINNTAGLSDTHSALTMANPLSTILYTVVGNDSYKCFTDTAQIKINVQPLPVVDAGRIRKYLVGLLFL